MDLKDRILKTCSRFSTHFYVFGAFGNLDPFLADVHRVSQMSVDFNGFPPECSIPGITYVHLAMLSYIKVHFLLCNALTLT